MLTIENKKTVATVRKLIDHLDLFLTPQGRELLLQTHDQGEMGAQRFFLHPMLFAKGLSLDSPAQVSAYNFSDEQKTLTLEVTSTAMKVRLQAISDEAEVKKDLAESDTQIITIAKIPAGAADEKDVTRQFFTNSSKLASDLIDFYLKNHKECKALTPKENKQLLIIYCNAKIDELSKKNMLLKSTKPTTTTSIFNFYKQQEAKEEWKQHIYQNQDRIKAYQDMIVNVSDENAAQIISLLQTNQNYLETIHIPICVNVVLVKQLLEQSLRLANPNGQSNLTIDDQRKVVLIKQKCLGIQDEIKRWDHHSLLKAYRAYHKKSGDASTAGKEMIELGDKALNKGMLSDLVQYKTTLDEIQQRLINNKAASLK